LNTARRLLYGSQTRPEWRLSESKGRERWKGNITLLATEGWNESTVTSDIQDNFLIYF
jgi:hypothetical protein